MSEKYSYDKQSDSLYINLREGAEDSCEEIVPGINLEFDERGEVIGVEVLKVSRFSKGLKKLAQIKNL